MIKLSKIILLSLFFVTTISGQNLSAIQQQNARATGYAIVAAKNPGKSFSVYLVKWDGINSLEHNANQINSSWHAQAAIKGNYFNQSFDGSDFTIYSSVVLSDDEFNIYKNTGTEWWIVCSTLPPFSNSSISISENGNLGIGTNNPNSKLEIIGSSQLGHEIGTLKLKSSTSNQFMYFGFDDQYSAGYIQSVKPGTNQQNILLAPVGGNIGIGTSIPDEKLTVKGKIHTQEVRVDMMGALVPDYVFANDYKLKSLEEVEKFIKENKHLPEIPSAQEIEKNGLMLAEMNLNLLKKMEEMTLYMIEMKKENETIKKENGKMKKKQIDLERRIRKIEK